jgi:hypothetical protein
LGIHDSGHILAQVASPEACNVVRSVGRNQETVIWHEKSTIRTM